MYNSFLVKKVINYCAIEISNKFKRSLNNVDTRWHFSVTTHPYLTECFLTNSDTNKADN